MPTVSMVSMVCESTASNVTAALRESLGSSSNGSGGGCVAAANAVATGSTADAAAALMGNSSNGHSIDHINDTDSLQSKLVASAKRVLLSKIDYEELDNYGQSVLDALKSKYILLKPNDYVNANGGNSNGVNGSSAADCNGNAIHTTTAISIKNGNATVTATSNASSLISNNSNAAARRSNVHELPAPKRVLFPRENVRVGWKSGTRKWQIGVGMMNVGNTCYLNSTLQALFHVPSMANWLASETQHMERCDDNGDAGCIICAMCKTFLMTQTHMAPIRPYSVYSKLRIICKHLVMGRQEDAHEFLRYLVEAMEKSYLSRFNNFKDLDQYSKETTPLNQILGGYLKSAVRCLSCNHVSVTFQHFQDLLLDIRKADTVEEALDAYFTRERLEDMGYKCESCKKKVSATKQFTLERAPIALCIQLKRFSMMGSKLNKQIAIRTRLDLSKYLSRKNPNEQYTYKLVSMITHLGASQHCGHYTAIGITESGGYYNFDDSCVRPISVQGVCNTNAYIIFYEMDNAPAALPRNADVPQTNNPISSIHLKENNGYQTKNGFSLSAKNNNNEDNTKSPNGQRLIGPQLPPGGLLNYNSPTSVACNGIKLKNVISNCASSIATTTTSTTAGNISSNGSGNNPKILIHYKNGPTTVRSNASSTTTTTTTTVSANSTISHIEKSNSPSGKIAATNHINGTTNGNCKLKESPHIKPASPLVKISIVNESSCSSEPEDGVSSTTDGYSECTVLEVETSSLPSMPNLFDDDEKSKEHCPALPTTFSDNSNSNKTSLVPYELESDDDNMWNITTKLQENQSPVSDKIECNSNKTQKRSSSFSLLENNFDLSNERIKSKRSNNSYSSPNIDLKTCTNFPQSKSKQMTENPIDEIFINIPKSSKRKSQSPQLTLSVAAPPSSPVNIDFDDCNGEEKYELNVTPPSTPYKNSFLTSPPSPPLIQTKTGLWQVTSINAADSTKGNDTNVTKKPNETSSPVSTSTSPIPLTPPRTWINPFAGKTTDTKPAIPQNSRPSEKRTQHIGYGYKLDLSVDVSNADSSSTGNSAVSELLQHSHRGYGAPVLTWNGELADIEKEVKSESRKIRQQDLDNEEENEIDRGRQKKVKQHVVKDYERTPGYNPFQEQDNQRCRWKSNSNGNGNSNGNSNSNGNGNSNGNSNSSNSNNSNGNNPYRYYSANYRQQPYLRNKSKYQRYNYNKYQRPQQQTNGNGYNSSNGSGNSTNNNSNYSGRRET